MTKTKGDMGTALERKIEKGFQSLCTKIDTKFAEIMNVLQEFRKNVDMMKDNGSKEQKEGFEIVSTTIGTHEQSQELGEMKLLDLGKDKNDVAKERTMGMPRFDGSSDAYWWLIQTRKYLESTGLPEESWLSFVDLGLDGEARDWFVSWRKVNQNVEFLQFVGDLLIKFQPEFGRYFQDVEEETVTPTEMTIKLESRTTLEQQLKDEEPVLEKERVPLAQESKREESMLIKKQQTKASPKKSNKPEVKTEVCKAQIWSKQNIALALKMRGITVKRKKSRARTDPRITVKEGIQANRTKETSNQAIRLSRREADRNKKRKQQIRHRLRTRRVICRPPPKPPDRNVRGGGKIKVLTTKRKRSSCMWVARPPPKPPDGHNCKGCCDYRNWLLCAGPRRNSRTTSSGKNCKRKLIRTSPTQGAATGCEEPNEIKAKNWSHEQHFKTTRQHLTWEEPRDYKTKHWNGSREPTLRARLFFKGAVLLDLGLVGDSKWKLVLSC